MKGLPTRQKEVLRLVSEGMSNKEIGKALGISDLTAKNHIQKLLRYYGVLSRIGMYREAMRCGDVEPPPLDGVTQAVRTPRLAPAQLVVVPDYSPKLIHSEPELDIYEDARVVICGKEIQLRLRAVNLLACLAKYKGRVCTLTILKQAYGNGSSTDNNLRVNLTHLKKSFEGSPFHIVCHYQLGYELRRK